MERDLEGYGGVNEKLLENESAATSTTLYVRTAEEPIDDTPEQAITRKSSVLPQKPVEERNGTILSSIFTLGNCALGLAILSLPFCTKDTGLIGVYIIMVFVASISAFALYCLGSVGIQIIENDPNSELTYYQVSVAAFPGKKIVTVVVDITVIINCFGCLISYLIVSGDQLTSVWGNPFGMPDQQVRLIWILLVFFIVMAPLTLIDYIRKNYSNAMNVLGVLGVIYSAILVIYKSIRAGLNPPPVYFTSDFTKFLYAIPIITCAFCCHHTMLSTTSALKDRTRKSITIISATSMVFPLLLYAAVATFGYLQLGDDVESNMMNSYDPSSAPVYIAKLALTLSMCTTYPLNFHPARQGMLSLLDRVTAKLNRTLVVWICNVVLMGASLAIAMSLKELDIVFSVMAICATIPVMFILPPLYYLRICSNLGYKKILGFMLLAYGVCIVPVSLAIFIYVVANR